MNVPQVTIEFDCDVEGDDHDGWEDDLDDDSDEGGDVQQAQQVGEEDEQEEDEEGMHGPGAEVSRQ